MRRDRYSPRKQAPKPQWPGLEGEAHDASPEEAFAAKHPQPLVETADLERAARRVIGVHSCRVLRNDGEALPYRVRVVAQGARRISVAKDIQSAWFTLWSIYVPRRLFVVTAVRSKLDLAPERRRLQLVQCTFTRAAGTLEGTVALFAGGQTFEGRASAPAVSADPLRLAAQAALVAVAAALPDGRGCDLLEMRRLKVAGVGVILCAVGDRQGQVLLGLSRVRGDERDAAVRAVLDAMNRLLAVQT